MEKGWKNDERRMKDGYRKGGKKIDEGWEKD